MSDISVSAEVMPVSAKSGLILRNFQVRLRMKNALKILTWLPMLWVTTAYATSPCEGDACIDAASASFIAPYDVFEAKCSAMNPELHARYSAIVAYFIRNEDTVLLKKLRVSHVYAVVRTEFESKVDALNSNQMAKACEDFLKEPSAEVDKSTQQH